MSNLNCTKMLNCALKVQMFKRPTLTGNWVITTQKTYSHSSVGIALKIHTQPGHTNNSSQTLKKNYLSSTRIVTSSKKRKRKGNCVIYANIPFLLFIKVTYTLFFSLHIRKKILDMFWRVKTKPSWLLSSVDSIVYTHQFISLK